jgi:hypothetical protein
MNTTQSFKDSIIATIDFLEQQRYRASSDHFEDGDLTAYLEAYQALLVMEEKYEKEIA